MQGYDQLEIEDIFYEKKRESSSLYQRKIYLKSEHRIQVLSQTCTVANKVNTDGSYSYSFDSSDSSWWSIQISNRKDGEGT